MLFLGYDNKRLFLLRGNASYSIEKQIIGNGSTKNFIVTVSEKVSIPHVTVYLISGTTATRVKDTVYTIVVNSTLPTQLQINFSAAPANNAVYKIFITNTQF
jgi:hypothetical protein